MELNVNKIIQRKINNINIDEVFQKKLEKQIEDTVQSALKDALGSYSAFSKALDELIKNQMGVNLQNISLAQYNNFVIEQCETVLKDIMSEERALAVQKKFRDRLAPNMVTEIKFKKLINDIETVLLDEVEEEANSRNEISFRVVCGVETGAYTTGSWRLSVYEGNKADFSNEKAVLYFNENGKVYHSRGNKTDEFTKLFASYVFNNTLIEDFEDHDRTIDHNDLY